MAKYDPAFWEVSVAPEILEAILAAPDSPEQALISPEEEQAAAERERLKDKAVALIRELIRTRLTERQRQVVELYFQESKSECEIAEILHVSQQVVSKHLYGVLREGRRVGGALKKLRELCDQLGITPEKWV